MSKSSATAASVVDKTNSPVGALSLRGGTMLMRSITRFLAKSKSVATATTAAVGGVSSCYKRHCGLNAGPRPPTIRRRKKMIGKDGKGKLSMKIIEAVKRETHFNKLQDSKEMIEQIKFATLFSSEFHIENIPAVSSQQFKFSEEILWNYIQEKCKRVEGAVAPSVASSGSTGAGAASIPPVTVITAQSTAAAGNTGAAPNHNPGGAVRKTNTPTEGIDRTVFCELMHITFDIVTEDMLMERIFCVWDRENANLITPMSWFAGLSIFLRGTTMEQIEFCFAVYDLNVDGFITKEEMFQLLKNCLIKHPQEEDPDEGVKDFVEIVMRKLDKDKDGKVSLNDYKQSVIEEPLLLEAFGKCLPEDRARDSFLSTMKV